MKRGERDKRRTKKRKGEQSIVLESGKQEGTERIGMFSGPKRNKLPGIRLMIHYFSSPIFRSQCTVAMVILK